MSIDQLLSLLGFAFASSITPGPNNLMLLASGANFGVLRSLPHMLGVSLGHGLMVFLVGLGLLQIFETAPLLRQTAVAICAVYLVFLAWKIATAASPEGKTAAARPLTFMQAAAFQWVNPKAIYMAIAAQTYYAPPGGGTWSALLVTVVFVCTNLPSVSVWCAAGTQLRRFLGEGIRLRIFNIAMAALLLASMALVIL